MVSILCFTAVSRADDCDLHSFLSSALFRRSDPHSAITRAFDPRDPVLVHARSVWGKSEAAKKLHPHFYDFHYLHSPKPLMNVFEESLAEKAPELIRILDDVNRFQMSTREFTRQFERNYGFYPKKSEVAEFYTSRFKLFEDGVEAYLTQLKKVDLSLGTRTHLNFLSQAEHHQEVLEHLVNGNDVASMLNGAEHLNQLMAGTLTELYATVSLPKVVHAGAKLSQLRELAPVLDDQIQKALDFLKKRPKEVHALGDKYPRVFWNPIVRKYRPYDHGDRMKMIREWIDSKEIDVIREQGGKTRWVEVKRNAEPFDLNHFEVREQGHSKSLLDQVLENKEIIEFLGLSDKIQLEYLATGGMRPEVKSLLEKHGIQVIVSQ